jgi:hypothetical protein
MQALFDKYSQPVSININKAEHHLVKFSMDKTIFQPGDILRAVFDFSNGVIPCYQVAVRLEMEEELVHTPSPSTSSSSPTMTPANGTPSKPSSSGEIPVYRSQSVPDPLANSSGGTTNAAKPPVPSAPPAPPRTKVIAEFHEATHNTSRTSISFNIPMEASPHFSTNLGSHFS